MGDEWLRRNEMIIILKMLQGLTLIMISTVEQLLANINLLPSN